MKTYFVLTLEGMGRRFPRKSQIGIFALFDLKSGIRKKVAINTNEFGLIERKTIIYSTQALLGH